MCARIQPLQRRVLRPLQRSFDTRGRDPDAHPQEAIEELDFAIGELGLKAAVFAGDVLRPVPHFAKAHPDLAHEVLYQDCFGIDSPFDYDPVWRKCIELKVAPTFHSEPIGWGSRRSYTRHQYNQIGGFAEGGEALAKALFFGGVTRRFPQLRSASSKAGSRGGRASTAG